jgi:hypothetical protein
MSSMQVKRGVNQLKNRHNENLVDFLVKKSTKKTNSWKSS